MRAIERLPSRAHRGRPDLGLVLSIRERRARHAENPQYPSLYLRYNAFPRREIGLQDADEVAAVVGARQPGGDAEGVMLIGVAVLADKVAAPQRRIDLGDGRAPR